MIKEQRAIVYLAPTKGRRYLSKRAAINAETIAIILKKYPPEKPESDEFGRLTYPGFDIRYDNEPDFKSCSADYAASSLNQ
ncbi:MAG: hypothetical protein ACMZI0_15025 [Symbiopectobacterium sp.]|uniref:hypothetical protein n=1 Tax=Symbiopectobacterium sp. TaxID=2952789 RepID=UPI0039E99DF6